MSSVAKPKPSRKPHRDFPLTLHPRGQWCKKILGTVRYFGRDQQAALELWLKEKDEWLAGLVPDRSGTERLTVKLACDAFLTSKERQLQSGEITGRHFADLKSTCTLLADLVGRSRRVDSLRPTDFDDLRAKLSKRFGSWALSNAIQRIRSVFKFALESELIEKPVRFGPTFKKPSKSIMRRERAEKGERLFSAADLTSIIDAAGLAMKAMILLGINCGLGNSDCGQLKFRHLDLAKGWLRFPRPKTGIDRKAKLWTETVEAIQAAVAKRPTPKSDADAELVFITKYGFAWANETPSSPVGHEFRKLLDDAGMYRPGLSFYTLRHQFETVAGATRDQVAVDHVMGHADASMGGIYRERIEDDRLQAVSEHVHGWLYGKAKRKPRAKRAKPAEQRQALRVVG